MSITTKSAALPSAERRRRIAQKPRVNTVKEICTGASEGVR